MKSNTSIRLTLLLVLGVLNLLIAVMLGYDLVSSYRNYQDAQRLTDSAKILNPLFSAQKYLAQERSWSVAAIYAGEKSKGLYTESLQSSRKNVDSNINSAIDELKQEGLIDTSLAMNKIQADYENLKEARANLDQFLISRDDKRRGNAHEVSNAVVVATTTMVTDAQLLSEEYARPLLALNPTAARQIRFSAVVGDVTEYANREYTVLAKLIAENQYPSQELQEQMALWRGRISYGWDIMQSSAQSNVWGEKARPVMDNAENNYFSTFDEIKKIFEPGKSPTAKPNYPVTVETWLDMASEAVDSLYAMNEVVIEIGIDYRKKIQDEAQLAIVINLLLFIITMTVSLYLWRLIVTRVIRPLDVMVDSLYKTATGEHTKIPTFNHSPDEIVKLAKVLESMQSYSAQLQIERDNAQAANLAKTDFLANVSHELRTPMNVVMGLSDILSRTEPLTTRQKEFLFSLNDSAKSLLSTINDILDFSQVEASILQLDKTQFNLRDLVLETSLQMGEEASKKGLQTTVNIENLSDVVYLGDPNRVRQIIYNVYKNAIKFTDEGQIVLEVSSKDLGTQDRIKIRLKDSGIGIPNDQLERIFERFTQVETSENRKYNGTGLGLAITKTLVEMMGGTISAESNVGEGSTFIINVVLEKASNMAVISSPQDPLGFHETPEKKILLVEDYVPNILVGTKYLEDLGYTCDVAETGEAAFEKFQNTRYAAVLLDVQLPDMLGYEVTMAIRAYEEGAGLSPTRIIGVTAYAQEKDRQKCLSAGMDDYLAKPYTPQQLLEKIGRRLN